MQTQFDVLFNHRRQYFTVFLEHTQENFLDRNGKLFWGYYDGEKNRRPRSGKFGEVHFYEPKFNREMAYHEILHLWVDWIRVKNGDKMLSDGQEENAVSEYWYIMRSFWKEYGKA